jgi:hypothetical protein
VRVVVHVLVVCVPVTYMIGTVVEGTHDVDRYATEKRWQGRELGDRAPAHGALAKVVGVGLAFVVGQGTEDEGSVIMSELRPVATVLVAHDVTPISSRTSRNALRA